MSSELQKLLLSAAIAGLTVGAVGCGSSTPSEPTGAHEAKEGKEKAKNKAKNKADDATAADTTQPAAPAAHECAGKNECKGQGGCKVAGQNEQIGRASCRERV